MAGEAVVVTGAAGGIGRACVAELEGRGFRVVGTVRREGELAVPFPSAREILLDLRDPAEVARAAEEIRSLGPPLRGIVHNAGMSRAGALEDLSVDEIREVLEVNLFGPLQLTRALLPDLRRTQGRLVFVGSGEGFLATPLNLPYCMAKHALEAMAAGLRLELAGSGVAVCVVSPGQTETPILSRARESFATLQPSQPYASLVSSRGRMAARKGAPPEGVARAVARALTERRPKARRFVGADSRGAYLLGRVAPEFVRRLVNRHLLGFG